MFHLTCVGVFRNSLWEIYQDKDVQLAGWQSRNLAQSEWRLKNNVLVQNKQSRFQRSSTGYEWVFIQAGKSQGWDVVISIDFMWTRQDPFGGIYSWNAILYMFESFVSPKKCIFVLSFWCRRVVAIKPNQAPNRRQFEEFEVKTSTVETMLSSRLMPGEKIGKRMGWVVLGEIWKWRWYWGNRTKKWTVFGVGRTYLISKVLFLGSCAIELTISSDPGWSFHVCCRLMTRGKSELTWLGCVCMFWMNYVVETVFEFRRLYNKSWSFSDMNRFVSNDCIYVYWIYVYYCTWFNQ